MPHELLDVLQALEPRVMRAARLARDLQGKVAVERKYDTGRLDADVVTQADRLVQSEILTAFADTALTGCRLLAEEDTDPALAARFTATVDRYLTLDPIDGTRRYTEGNAFYSAIVGLHDGRTPLYTFVYYPAHDWWVRLRGNAVETSGPPPATGDPVPLNGVIVYTMGRPAEQIPEVVAELEAKGCRFAHGESVKPCGSKFLLLSGQADGYYVYQPNPYDGIVAMHWGLAHGQALRGSGLDLRDIRRGPAGDLYPGWYVVLPRGVQA